MIRRGGEDSSTREVVLVVVTTTTTVIITITIKCSRVISSVSGFGTWEDGEELAKREFTGTRCFLRFVSVLTQLWSTKSK